MHFPQYLWSPWFQLLIAATAAKKYDVQIMNEVNLIQVEGKAN